jgi:uncharacterized membrane protein YccC
MAETPHAPRLPRLDAFDWSALSMPDAVRGALGVTLPLVVGWLTGHVEYGAYTALGALPAGFSSFEGQTRTRVGGVVVASVGMAVATFVGATAAAGAPWLLPLMVAIWAYATGLSVSLGPVANVAVLQWAVALLIAIGMPFGPEDAAVRSGFVLIGGLLQAALVIVSWTLRPGSREQASLAASFKALAADASRRAAASVMEPPSRPLLAEAVLGDPNPLLPDARRLLLLDLLEQGERVRAALAAFDVDASGENGAGARAVLHDAAVALEFVRWSLAAPAADLRASVAMLEAQVTGWKIPSDVPWRWSAEALAGQLCAIVPMLKALEAPREEDRRAAGASEPARAHGLLSAALSLKAHVSPSTEAGRHALRLAIVAALAEVLAQVTGLTQGRWITLTVLIVLKPDYGSTFGRSLHRALGTMLGACVAAGIAHLGHAPGWLVLACAVAVTLAFAVFRVNYFLYSVPLTVFILVLLALMGSPALASAEARIVDTFVGSVLGLLAYLAWPTWKGATAQQEFAALLEAHRDYAMQLLRELAHPGRIGGSRLRELEFSARRARSAAQAAAARLAAERPRAPFTAALAERLLAAVARLASAELALHTLVISGDPGAPVTTDHHVCELRAALETVMTEMAEALRRLEAPRTMLPLRPLQAGLAAASDARGIAFVTIAGRLVDATDTAYDLLRGRLPSHYGRNLAAIPASEASLR